MRATATPAPTRQGKLRLLESCAILAGMAALACGGPALAQVAGTGQGVTGPGLSAPTISPPGPGATNVNTTGAQTIIDWTPTDNGPGTGAIDFLPEGNTLNFNGFGNYTVLNRFVNGSGGSLSRQIALNGTVNSTNSATSGQRGGNIWFYNAGGILIGATGVINVGSLVLTANDVVTTNGLFGPGGTIRFNGTSGSTSAITVNGAINANNVGNPGSSYVALVAPRIVQAGAVRVDGSVAYVAAERADIRINGGLFDINVTTGAAGGNAITHTGTTTGPAHQQGDTDQSRIYMVAIPKNDAVTMLVSGQVGYDDAVTAQTDPDGAVRLSAGYNIFNGELDSAPVNATAANITVNDTLFRSSTVARASGAFLGQPLAQVPTGGPFTNVPPPHLGRLIVQGDGTFIGDASATINVNTGRIVGATGNLTLSSSGTNGAPGSAAMNVTGGTLATGGTLSVLAGGQIDALTGNSSGGNAAFTISSGTALLGDLYVGADAVADTGTDGIAGTGTGGTATIALLGGTLNSGSITASAAGTGGVGPDGSDDNAANIIPGGPGGTGIGGNAAITIDGATVTVGGTVAAYADGQGGRGGNFSGFSGIVDAGGVGGTGQGGTATIDMVSGTLNTGALIAGAGGFGGNGGNVFASSSSGSVTGIGVGGNGGSGQGGVATIDLAAPVNAGVVASTAAARGGDGGFGLIGGSGGDALGGLAQIIIDDFDAGMMFMNVDASARGGDGAFGDNGAGGDGGDGTGGTGRIEATGANGRKLLSQANFQTDGTGGNGGSAGSSFFGGSTVGASGGSGGSGTGGILEIVASGGATIVLSSDAGGLVSLGSDGAGGIGGDGAFNGFGEGFIGGDGGDGGAAVGGTVRLFANGGTITSLGSPVSINVGGVSGDGGLGGTGTSGNGAAGAIAQTTGGRALIEASGVESPAAINLGATSIAANGDIAGRIEMRTTTGAAIRMASLTANAFGAAAPTNNDTDTATAGIFLATPGGTIATTGAMSLNTDSSFGAYAQSNGTVSVGGNLTITAADQIDIRHDAREGIAPTIRATGDFTATAGSISAAAGSQLGSGGTLSLTATTGALGVDRLDATDIILDAAGAISVEHAEALDDFTATGASFRTGLNSIITGGDIVIAAPGTVDLGNSNAGGLVLVDGQAITFNNVVAGGNATLRANGFGAGDGVTGVNVTAGGDVTLNGRSIAVSGTVDAGRAFSASAFNGNLAIGLVDAASDVRAAAAGNLTGVYRAGGNVQLNASGNITAEADAFGTYVNPATGLATEGRVFVDAAGNATLTDSSAATMLAVRAGGAANINGGVAGEDIFVLAGTTATLSNLTAGDDIQVQASGGANISNAVTTGAGPNARSVVYAACCSNPAPFLQVQSSAPDGSNITVTASAGPIGGGNLNAFDDLTLIAGGAVTTTGTLRSGGATSINGDSISFAAIDAGSTVDLSATNAISGTNITAGDNINLSGNDIAITGTVTGGGSFFAFGNGGPVAVNLATVGGDISIFAQGDLTGTYNAAGDIRLNSGANVNASANATGFESSSSGPPTAASVFVDAAGNVTLNDSSATSMFGVNAGGSATVNGASVGEDMLVIAGTNASLSNVTAGDDIEVRAVGNISAANVRATGTGPDNRILSYAAGNGFTISQGEGTSATNGSDIFLTAGGSIDAATLSAADDIIATAQGAIALNGATTLGLGTTGGASDIRTQGGNTTLAGLSAFTDVAVASTGTVDVTGPVAAGRNIGVNANAVTMSALSAPGGEPINNLSADGNIVVASTTGITGGRIRALGDINLTAGTAIDVAGIFGNIVAVDGATGIAADQVFAVGTTTLNSNNGAITLGTLVSGGEVDARADSIAINGGSMVFANIITDVGDAVVRAGDLFVQNGSIAGRAEFSSSGERLGIDTLTARSAQLDASNGFMTLNNVSVNGGLAASARTSLGITGVVTGQSISLASANIDIASTGRVGTAGATGEVSIINNNNDNQTFVGGNGTRNGYHIDAAELTRVFGSDIEIFAPRVAAVGGGSVGSAVPPDVIVDSFTMTGGAANSNLGASGLLTIRTPGKMRVLGNVQLTGLSDTNTLNLFGDDSVEVILGSGSVHLSGQSPDQLGGHLTIRANDIVVATTQAIADIAAMTSTAAIETRLAQNDGITSDIGALSANRITLTHNVTDSVYIQNSGIGTAYDERRGITFGAGGLFINGPGNQDSLVINAVQRNAAGGLVTGLAVLPLVNINAPSGSTTVVQTGFNAQSTINGCVIANSGACVVVNFENSFPVQDVIEEEADADSDDGDGNSLPLTPLITMRDLDPLSGEPLLDDPVTGAGNDDLWTPTDEP